jgi:hypothetical protein
MPDFRYAAAMTIVSASVSFLHLAVKAILDLSLPSIPPYFGFIPCSLYILYPSMTGIHTSFAGHLNRIAILTPFSAALTQFSEQAIVLSFTLSPALLFGLPGATEILRPRIERIVGKMLDKTR